LREFSCSDDDEDKARFGCGFGIVRVIRSSKTILKFEVQFFLFAPFGACTMKVAAATEQGFFVRRQLGLYIRVKKSLRKSIDKFWHS